MRYISALIGLVMGHIICTSVHDFDLDYKYLVGQAVAVFAVWVANKIYD